MRNATDSREEILRRLDFAKQIAERAGEILLSHLGKLESYEEKSPANLVTIADRESEAFLQEALRTEFPGDLFLMEENDGAEGATRRRSELSVAEFAWCIDPLDGTTSFVHSYPAFAVSMGLLRAGAPVLGVVYAPARRELFEGGIGVPAALNGRPIQVSRVSRLSEALIGTGFHRSRTETMDSVLGKVREILLTAHDLRRAGAAALDLCDVAAGRLDAFFETGLFPWDVVAGHAILEAAGGQLTDERGEPHDVFGQNTVASNGRIHQELLAILDRGRVR